jgi:protein TonB
MIQNLGNRSVFAIAAGISLIAHISLASIFVERDLDAQIAGGSVVSVAIMGDGSVDQLLAGEIDPNAQKKYQEPNAPLTELKAVETSEPLRENPTEALKVLPKDLAVLEPQNIAPQSQDIIPTQEPNVEPKPEPLEIKTASIFPQIAPQNAVQTLQSTQIIAKNIDSNASEILESSSDRESIAKSVKVTDLIDADKTSDLVPIPQFRPSEDYQKQVQTASLAPQQPAKKVKEPLAKKKSVVSKSASGNGGKNKSNVKKGTLSGKAEKGSTGSSKRGNSKSTGNGNITNYKGKVRRKIARKFNPRTRPAKRDAVVSFSISKNGSAQSIRLARSSGNAKLDRAALSAVKSASPFPSLPSGKSKLAFHVPLNAR